MGYLLRKEVYHCTREELAEADNNNVILDWSIREALRREEAKEAEKDKRRYNKHNSH